MRLFRKFDDLMEIISKLDEDIIELLEHKEGIKPNSTFIAKRLKKPITTIHSRIKRMYEKGILKGFNPRISRDINQKKITAFILLQTAQGIDPDEFGKKIASIDEVKEVFFTTGEWYFMVKVEVNNLDEYYKISGETLVKMPEITKVVGMMVPKSYKNPKYE